MTTNSQKPSTSTNNLINSIAYKETLNSMSSEQCIMVMKQIDVIEKSRSIIKELHDLNESIKDTTALLKAIRVNTI